MLALLPNITQYSHVSSSTQNNLIKCSRWRLGGDSKLVDVSYLLRARGCAFNRCTLKRPLFALFPCKAPVIHLYELLKSSHHHPALQSLWPADKMTKNWKVMSSSSIPQRDGNSMTLTQRPPSPTVCVYVIRLNGVALWVMPFNAGDLINGDWR